MKTIAPVSILLGATLVCLAAAGYRPVLIAMERHTRRTEILAAENGPLLVLDAMTKSILAGADRVETFRLVEDADSDPTPAQLAEIQAATTGPHVKTLDDYTVLRTGPPQGKAFAEALQGALAQAEAEQDGAQCFSPGVGFRVWKGLAHVDLCVCFHCSGVEITTTNAGHKAAQPLRYNLGRSRAAFLALSRQAFPQDAALAAVKDTEED